MTGFDGSPAPSSPSKWTLDFVAADMEAPEKQSTKQAAAVVFDRIRWLSHVFSLSKWTLDFVVADMEVPEKPLEKQQPKKPAKKHPAKAKGKGRRKRRR